MAKVIIKDKKSLEIAKEKMRGMINFRQTKGGIVAAKQKRRIKRKPGIKPSSANS